MSYNANETLVYNSKGCANSISVTGTISDEPVKTHTVKGERMFEFKVNVTRKSGALDTIPVIIPENAILNDELKKGDFVNLSGEIRTYNKLCNHKWHLCINMFVKSYKKVDKNRENNTNNVIKLAGYVCKQPVYRLTPFSREICDVILAVNRNNNNKTDYIPVIFWGRNARFASENLKAGDRIAFEGRFQSREYIKITENNDVITKTAYEVSANSLQKLEKLITPSENDILIQNI